MGWAEYNEWRRCQSPSPERRDCALHCDHPSECLHASEPSEEERARRGEAARALMVLGEDDNILKRFLNAGIEESA